jgi:hypothetical protein
VACSDQWVGGEEGGKGRVTGKEGRGEGKMILFCDVRGWVGRKGVKGW